MIYRNLYVRGLSPQETEKAHKLFYEVFPEQRKNFHNHMLNWILPSEGMPETYTLGILSEEEGDPPGLWRRPEPWQNESLDEWLEKHSFELVDLEALEAYLREVEELRKSGPLDVRWSQVWVAKPYSLILQKALIDKGWRWPTGPRVYDWGEGYWIVLDPVAKIMTWSEEDKKVSSVGEVALSDIIAAFSLDWKRAKRSFEAFPESLYITPLSEEQSRDVQEVIFSYGVTWAAGEDVVQHTEQKHLHIHLGTLFFSAQGPNEEHYPGSMVMGYEEFMATYAQKAKVIGTILGHKWAEVMHVLTKELGWHYQNNPGDHNFSPSHAGWAGFNLEEKSWCYHHPMEQFYYFEQLWGIEREDVTLLSADEAIPLLYGEAPYYAKKDDEVQLPRRYEYRQRESVVEKIREADLPQKVKALSLLVASGNMSGLTVPPFTALRSTDLFTEDDLPHGDPLFVRPSPFVPNHGAKVAGFESVKVARKDAAAHIAKVQQAMREEDPRAGILVMPYLSARLSAVAAPNQYIAIGMGHDGVTAGTSDPVVLPLRQREAHWIKQAGEDPERIELELIYTNMQQVRLVQLRRAESHVAIAAPPTKDARPGFVPQGTIEVKSIYVVKDLDDLGELEVLGSMDTEGLLVIQPMGSMLSHAAAHCRGMGVAFVVDEPEAWEVGDTLSDARGWVVRGHYDGPGYDPVDYAEDFWDGVEGARAEWEQSWGKLATFFHQYTTNPLNGPEATACLAGMFVGWLAMAGMAACLGELRHIGGCYEGDAHTKNVVATLLYRLTGYDVSLGIDRGSLYEELSTVKPSWKSVRTVTELAEGVFSEEGAWEGGYGGEAWESCAEGVLALVAAIEKRDVARTIRAANDLENRCHNGGNLFNKHVDESFFTYATQGFFMEHPDPAFEVAQEVFRLATAEGTERSDVGDTWVKALEESTSKPVEYYGQEEEEESASDWAKAELA